MANVIVVHNVPVSYKTLLFDALSELTVDVAVCYTASGNGVGGDSSALHGSRHKYSIAHERTYETASVFLQFCSNPRCCPVPLTSLAQSAALRRAADFKMEKYGERLLTALEGRLTRQR